ncbi:MAG TPA: hypothetical protein VGE95_07375 [Arthrobacter sp.]
MSKPKEIVRGLSYEDEGPKYLLDGKRATSVTTILSGGIPKPFLVPWAARKAAEFAVANPGASFEEIKEAPNRERDAAAVRGTAVHDIAEKIIHGEAVDIPEELYAYVDGYVRFLDAFNVQPLLIEKPVANRRLGYAGRFDAIVQLPGLHGSDPVMVDLKTSNGVYRETKAQCAAYSLADFYVEPDAPTVELPLPEIQASYVAHITPDGTFLHPLARDRAELLEHFEIFEHAHAIYRFGLAKHKVLDPLPYPSIEFEAA